MWSHLAQPHRERVLYNHFCNATAHSLSEMTIKSDIKLLRALEVNKGLKEHRLICIKRSA